ncbi:protein-L-isoaspartate O-methyltransferase [Pseudoxanthomonas sp. SL93]|jgi:protein-L-isoaspartate(D-aspartate) O-methyltransferase|uniref:protein-L-isoaspartate O-methyltransferase family protein n=1 Tax=Pseudoxanthomonas sp. SL93 TaxID=2995142 RepID=UPI00226F8549|nr:protein-L-isoaspartate O-methyltransferase [Pseudoxanthomonas sp. SL93]WAC62902.1 protein-L-isoaspartate O-methyltransferase [Pseudoxanthomonas sp. SL93]
MTIDYTQARENMVEQQVRPWDVLDARVLDTLATLPREAFVADAHRALAYADLELPLGDGQAMMKPVVEGRTLQALKPQADEDVLEIGTGSGYLAACLGHLARDVLSLEIHPGLAAAARARLDAAGLGNNVRIETADALTYDTDRRFDVVCVTGAVSALPAHFLKWLRPGGRLFVVQGASPVMEAVLHVQDVNGTRTESLFETDLPYLIGAAPAPQFVF